MSGGAAAGLRGSRRRAPRTAPALVVAALSAGCASLIGVDGTWGERAGTSAAAGAGGAGGGGGATIPAAGGYGGRGGQPGQGGLASDGGGGGDARAPVCGSEQPGSGLWARSLCEVGSQTVGGLAVAPSGDIVVSGTYAGRARFGDITIEPEGGAGTDAYVAKLGPGGAALWARSLGEAGDDTGWGCAVDAAGGVLLHHWRGALGETVTKLAPNGDYVWTHGAAALRAIVPDQNGDVLLVREHALLKLSGASDTTLWSRPFGGTAAVMGKNLWFTLAGEFTGTLALTGDCKVTSAGSTDVFLATLDPNGDCGKLVRFGDAAPQHLDGMVRDPAGNLYLLGRFAGTIDLGGGPLTSHGGLDVFLAKLGVGGGHLFSRSWGGPEDDGIGEVIVDGGGRLAVSAARALDAAPAPGSFGVPIVELDVDGGFVRSANPPTAGHIAFSSAGRVLWAGPSAEPAVFGCGAPSSCDPAGAVLAELGQ